MCRQSSAPLARPEDSPKSEKSIRSEPFNKRLAAELTAYLETHPKRGVDDTAPLWPGRNYGGYGDWRGGLDWEKRMDYNSFYRHRFRAAATAIGYPELRFHDLRHTAASIWASDGMKLERVAAALGHAGTSTTYKVYLHFFKDDYGEDMGRSDAKYQRHSPPAVTTLRQAEGWPKRATRPRVRHPFSTSRQQEWTVAPRQRAEPARTSQNYVAALLGGCPSCR